MSTRFLTATLVAASTVMFCLPTASAQQTRTRSRATPKTPADPAKVLALAPADALVLAYTSDLPLLLENPLLKRIQKETGKSGKLLDAIGEAFGGAAFFSFSGVPNNPMTWALALGARTALPRAKIVEILTGEITYLGSDSESIPNQVTFFDDGRVLHITLVGPATFNLDLAVKGNLIFASSRPFEAQAWLDAGNLPNRFTGGEDHARIVQGHFSDPSALIYVNLRPLLAMAEPLLNQQLPHLYEALQLEDVQFIASVTRDAEPPVGSEANATDAQPANHPTPTKPPTQRIAIGFTQQPSGIWEASLGTPGALSLAKYFPGKTPLFLNGSMESLADLVESANAFIAMIGQEIVDEYEQECRDFRRDTGVDPHGEILANLAGEWAIAGPFHENGGMLFAIRLGDVAKFRAHLLKLKRFFNLKTRNATYRGVTIERAKRVDGEFYFAVVDDVLLAAADGRVLKSGLDAYADDTSLARSEAFRTVAGDPSDGATTLAYLDMVSITNTLLDEEEEIPDEVAVSLIELLARQQAIGVEVAVHDRLVAVDLTSAADEGLAPSTLIATVVMPSLARSRELSMRLVSQSNIKGIAVSVMIYQADHDSQMPPNLKTLLDTGNFTQKTLTSPYNPRAKQPGGSFYLYRPLGDLRSVQDPANAVILSESELREGGANFGFLDGHTEWIEGPRAAQLLRVMKTGN